MLSRLDEKTLTAIAQATGGSYHSLGPRGEGLTQIRLALETQNHSAVSKSANHRGIDRFYCPVAALLALLIGESLLGTRRKERATP